MKDVRIRGVSRTAFRGAVRLPSLLAIVLVRAYQYLVSPTLHWLSPGCGCRFHPTCSEYGIEAFRSHGFLRGSWLTIYRIVRCQPWGGAGYDPVPPARPDDEKATSLHHPSCGHH